MREGDAMFDDDFGDRCPESDGFLEDVRDYGVIAALEDAMDEHLWVQILMVFLGGIGGIAVGCGLGVLLLAVL